jgi:diguanylate cyclase (GGDEF)-like protein
MSSSQRSLLTTLHRANLRLITGVMASAWIAITVIAYINLRVYGDQSLNLVAHSIAYSSQAATVFRDSAAAHEMLGAIGAEDELVSAQIVQRDGQELASFQRSPDNPLEARLAQLGDVLFPQSSVAEIRIEDRVIGWVTVQGNTALYVEFFGKTLAAALLCLVGVAVSIGSLSREVERKVVGPLRHLAALTHVVRLSRQFDRRAPGADVAEINQLGDDFNALLAEIEMLEKSREEHTLRLQRANEQLGHQIRHDGLTGLANRVCFYERLEAELARDRSSCGPLAVLYVDYDNFKSVNDQFGHAAGDELLIEAGRRIRALLRDTDTVARLGGDEFGVLVTPLAGVGDAEELAARVVATMHEPISIGPGRDIVSSVSVGVALYPDHAQTMERLLSAADLAMYQAKTEKRNAFCVAGAGEGAPRSGAKALQPNPSTA